MILVVDLNRVDLPLSPNEFVAPIVDTVKDVQAYSVIHYTQVDLDVLELVDAAILSGTTLKDTGYLENPDSFDWIDSFEKPVLGICAGMQVMGLRYGSSLLDCREVGLTEVKTARENPIFSGEFTAYCLHKKSVVPSEEFVVLANSKDCVEAVKHRVKNHYGVLFHPEVRNREIIHSFIRLLDHD